jgi:hypothetical protein
MNCPKCNEDIMSMSVHFCNRKVTPKKYTQSPRERGEVDYYYSRTARPHYYDSMGERESNLTSEEIEEYWKGYRDFEKDNIRDEFID